MHTMIMVVVVMLVVAMVMLVLAKTVVVPINMLVLVVPTFPAFVMVHVQMVPMIFFPERGVGLQFHMWLPPWVRRSAWRFERRGVFHRLACSRNERHDI